MADQNIVKGVANMKSLGFNPYTHTKDGQPLPRLIIHCASARKELVNQQKEDHCASAGQELVNQQKANPKSNFLAVMMNASRQKGSPEAKSE